MCWDMKNDVCATITKIATYQIRTLLGGKLLASVTSSLAPLVDIGLARAASSVVQGSWATSSALRVYVCRMHRHRVRGRMRQFVRVHGTESAPPVFCVPERSIEHAEAPEASVEVLGGPRKMKI